MYMYNRMVMEHYRNPRNVGEVPDADGVGRVGNPVSGDTLTVYVKVKDGILKEVKFRAFGCVAAIATGSMVTEMGKEKTVEEALKITGVDVANSLDGLPSIKMFCSNMAADGLHAAIRDYLGKKV